MPLRLIAQFACFIAVLVFNGCMSETLPAEKPATVQPVRLVSFDPVVRKVGVTDAQTISLLIPEGPEAGSTLDIHIVPSKLTGNFVGKTLYLKWAVTDLKPRQNTIFLAGGLLDTDPVPVKQIGYTATVAKDIGNKYQAAVIELQAQNEIAGSSEPSLNPSDWTSPAQAIYTAAKVAPDGVKGVFAMQVKLTGKELGMIYLNSEADYRDQRCLTIAIPPWVAADLKLKYGTDADVFFKDKRIVVSGIAERVKIVFAANGKPTDKYYYQTHVNVSSAHQIRMMVVQ